MSARGHSVLVLKDKKPNAGVTTEYVACANGDIAFVMLGLKPGAR